jgi:hypothetical protein
MSNVTIEVLERVEAERAETMSKAEFVKWMAELNVGRLYEDPTGRLKAREIMSEYVFKKRG